MASTTCGNCGRLAHMEAASGLHIVGPDVDGNIATGHMKQAVYKCPNCRRLNIATEWSASPAGEGTTVYANVSAADDVKWHSPQWLPRHKETLTFEGVEAHIAQAATEATLCLSVGAYRAVGALARAVIEATAKDKKAGGGNLAKRIDALREADLVRRHTAEQAHEIRHFGNEMAHGDFVEPVTKGEAEEVVALMCEVLDEVYQSPARLEKRRARARAAKEQAAGA